MGYLAPEPSQGAGPKSYLGGSTAPPAAPPQPESHSITGFLGNVVSGLEGLVSGVGKLAVTPIADLTRMGLEAATLGKIDLPGGYLLPQVGKSLLAAPQDYWDRYSPLLPGGRPASQFLQEAYDKPVSFGLDALAAASVAGKAAGLAGEGRLASEAAAEAGVPKLVGEAAQEFKTALRQVPETASLSEKTAHLANIRKALEGSAEASGTEAPWYSKLLPEYRNVRVGNNVEDNLTTTLRNPILRAGQNLIETKLGSHSTLETIEQFRSRIDEQAAKFGIDDGGKSIADYIAREREIADQAEALGMERIQKPWESSLRATQTYRNARNLANGTWFRDRLKSAESIKKIWAPRVKAMDPEELSASPLRSSGGNVLVEGFANPDAPIVKRTVSQSGRYAESIDLTSEPVPLNTSVDPAAIEAAKAVAPEYQVTEAHAVLDELTQVLQQPDLPVLGIDAAKELDAVQRMRDTLVTDTEGLASGNFDLQQSGDALDHAKDIVERGDQLKTLFEDSPSEYVARSYRNMMDVSSIAKSDWEAIPGLTLRESKQAHDAILDHVSEVSSVERKAERVAASARTTSKATRRGGVLVGMGAEAERLSEAAITRLEKRREFLQGEINQYDQELPLSVEGTHPLGNVAKNQKRIADLQAKLDEVNTKLEAGTRTPPDMPVPTAQGITRQKGGLLPEFMAAGGLKDRNWVISSLMEEVRQALGPELSDKILSGITNVSDLRTRLERLQTDPTSLVGDAWRELDDARRAAGLQAPGYFPMIDINRVSKSDWLMRQPGSMAALKAAKDPHEKWNSGRLFIEDRYLKDPLKARLLRSARHARADGTLRALEAVVNSKVGRILEPGQHIAPDERVIPLEYMRGVNRISKEYYDSRLKYLEGGMASNDAALAAMQDVVNSVQDRIASGEIDAGTMHMYAVPEKVAREMTAAARAAGIINGPLAKVYFQGPMNVWRSLVLAGSPRWIVNNVLGNSVFSIMQGAPVIRALHLLEQRYKEILNEKYGWNLKTGSLDEIRTRLTEAGFDETNVFQESRMGYNPTERTANQYVPGAETVPGPGGRWLANSRNAPGRALRTFRKVGDSVRAFNSEIESAYRMNSALTAAEQLAGIGRLKRMMYRFQSSNDRMNAIFRDGLTESSARQVAREMNHFLGDFGDLGPWERNLVRPYIAPFWGFYKHVGKLLISYPFEYPERALVLNGLANVTQDMVKNYGPMPGWLDGAIPLDKPGPEVKFLTTTGPNPFSGLFQSPIGLLSPPLKMALEQFQARSAFTGQRFSDANTFSPFGSDQFYDIHTGQPVGPPRPNLINQALSQIPQYDMLKDLIAGGATYDTSSILDRAVIRDSEGNPKYPTDVMTQLARLFGFPTTTYNLGAYQESLTQGQQQALAEALKRAG